MFLDAQDWAHWYGQEHRVAGERERLCRLAEQGNPDEGLAFRVGGWLIGLGRWLQGGATRSR
ncbi:hypothetical protein [Thermoflexus hugenholtzii]